MNIRKGDTIKILSGKDRGKTGKVMKASVTNRAILVAGLNLYSKHQRPKRKGEKGEIVKVARPMPVSKVMLMCPSCGRAVRIGHRFEGDSKVRYCKNCNSNV